MEISAEIKSEKMTAMEPDYKSCVHEFGIRAFRVPAEEFGDGSADDFYGLCLRIVGHQNDADGNEKVVSIDLTFDEDLSRRLLLETNEQCTILADHKYANMTPDEMSDALAERLANGLMAMLGITIPDDKKEN